ncbi:hypothetical protein ACJ2A9_12495 [Anaerobacillus sp. MEB173]|uniref:hypothetical protein n=1 Tax=Anaerobacillus sp. MEB173 TaxID=3383345 RepID=UPI003F8F240E
MNEWISERRTIVIVGLAVLFLILAMFYYFLLQPAREQLKQEEQAIAFEQQLIDALEKRGDRDVQPEENTAMLERRVPLHRAVDQYLLSLQAVEAVSGTTINSVSFSQYGGELTEADETYTVIDEYEEFQEEAASIGQRKDEPVEEAVEVVHPEEIQTIRLSLNVTSPDYDSLIDFIEELEQAERITNIHTVNFTAPGEEGLFFTDEEDQDLSFTIDLSIYYYENEM